MGMAPARILGTKIEGHDMVVRIPIPPSVNHYLRHYCKDAPEGVTHRIGVKLTDKAKQFKRDAGWLAKRCGIRMYDAPTRVRMDIEAWTGLLDIDLDNINKLVMDALIGIAYEDDRQVKMIVSYMHEEGKYKPHMEVRVSPL